MTTTTETILNQNKQYHLFKEKNNFFLWLTTMQKNGYSCPYHSEDLQQFIQLLTSWYELKYPENDFDLDKDTRFDSTISIASAMNFEQLLYRLPSSLLNLIECPYRSKYFDIEKKYTDQITFSYVSYIGITLKQTTTNSTLPLLIRAFPDTGMVAQIDHHASFYVQNPNISIEELLKQLQEHPILNLDYSELEEVIKNHQIDIELRNKILLLTTFHLLYSENTTIDNGYQRAKHFIEEFNLHIPHLQLTTEEIDNIFHKYKDNTFHSRERKF